VRRSEQHRREGDDRLRQAVSAGPRPAAPVTSESMHGGSRRRPPWLTRPPAAAVVRASAMPRSPAAVAAG
jgi:hypothetical protein